MIYTKNKRYLLSLTAFFSLAGSVVQADGEVLDASKLKLTGMCPVLVQADLNALASTGEVEKEGAQLRTAMPLDEFKKQIPGTLYVISKRKDFAGTGPVFTREEGGKVRATCTYTWQSALAGITKNTHTFTINYDTGYIVTLMTVKNGNTKPVEALFLKKGNTSTNFYTTVHAATEEEVSFLQGQIDKQAPDTVKEVVVSGKIQSNLALDNVANCPAVPTGGKYLVTFIKKISGTGCEIARK